MKITSVLAAVLAGSGLATASRCKPSPVSSSVSSSAAAASSSVAASPSVSSASSSISAASSSVSSYSSVSSVSSSSSAIISVASSSSSSIVSSSSSAAPSSSSSSSSVAPAPTCGPDSTAMGSGTDIANSGMWTVHDDSAYNVDTSISTCHGSPTNDCLTFTPLDTGSSMIAFFSYNTNVVVGVTYTYTFQFTQDTSTVNTYPVYTSNTGQQVNVAFTAGAGNWQTAVLTVTPTSTVTNLNVLGSVSAGTSVTFANFAFYQNC